MKALPLLQALAEVQKRAIWQPVLGKRAMYRVNERYRREVDSLLAFYSQPFTVEMLTGERAIFAGWEKPHTVRMYKSGKSAFVSDGGRALYKGKSEWVLPIPITIAQFIEDCDRAGIPLTLTPYGQEMLKGNTE